MHSGPARRRGANFVRGFGKRAISLNLGLLLCIASLIGNATRGHAAGVMMSGNLANFDVRYSPSLPNDLEIVLYGDGLKTNDVVEAWNSNILLGGVGAQWGLPISITGSVNTDVNSPAFGLDCVVVRYAGPPRPALVDRLVHFGVRLRIGAVVAHQEVWWSINGQRILRPCDPHIVWSCTTNGWLVCVANPTPAPIYVYGTRSFPVATNAPLPTLSQLNTSINPSQFGATNWTSLNLPGGQRVFCLQPWCCIYLRVQSATWRPIVFQIAARNVPESVLPLPPGTTGPNPNDWNGGFGQGTMAILTTRPTQEFAEDINGDGVVGVPDFNQLRSRFGAISEDR